MKLIVFIFKESINSQKENFVFLVFKGFQNKNCTDLLPPLNVRHALFCTVFDAGLQPLIYTHSLPNVVHFSKVK
jgi:hypothetical protein